MASGAWLRTWACALIFYLVAEVAALSVHVAESRAGLKPAPKARTVQSCVTTYADSLDMIRVGLGTPIRHHPLQAKAISNRTLLIGAGSGNTGTHSLHNAMLRMGLVSWHAAKNKTWDERRAVLRQILGTAGPGCHEKLRAFDYVKLLDGCDFVVDMPTAELFLEFFLAYPKAKYVLSTRPKDDWVSGRVLTHEGVRPPMQEPCGLTLDNFSHADLAELYMLNNNLVKCVVPADQLIEFDLWADSTERLANLMTELARFVEPWNTGSAFLEKTYAGPLPNITPAPKTPLLLLEKFTFSCEVEMARLRSVSKLDEYFMRLHSLAVNGCAVPDLD